MKKPTYEQRRMAKRRRYLIRIVEEFDSQVKITEWMRMLSIEMYEKVMNVFTRNLLIARKEKTQ